MVLLGRTPAWVTVLGGRWLVDVTVRPLRLAMAAKKNRVAYINGVKISRTAVWSDEGKLRWCGQESLALFGIGGGCGGGGADPGALVSVW